MRFRLQILVICMAIFGPSLSQAAPEKPVALILQITDGKTIRPSGGNYLSRLVKIVRPDLEVRIARVYPSQIKNLERPQVSELVAHTIEDSLRPNDIIDLMFIATHGKQQKFNTPQATATYLQSIGRFYENGDVGENLKISLSPLRGRFTRSATILLNSCETFCGNVEASSRRAKSFMNFLRIPEGSIFGADTFMFSMEFDKLSMIRPDSFIPSLNSFRNTVVISAYLFFFPYLVYDVFNAIPDAQSVMGLIKESLSSAGLKTLKTVALTTPFFYTVINPILVRAGKLNSYNKGFFFSFKKGQVEKVESVVLTDEIESLIESGGSCQRAIKPN